MVQRTSRSFLVGAAVLLWLACIVPQAVAQKPAVIDGAFTTDEEWRDANVCRDLPRLGWVYIKQVKDYPEPGLYTLQVCHYFNTYRTLESYDANSMGVKRPDGSEIMVWIFMRGECPSGPRGDKQWVEKVGLQESPFYDPRTCSFKDDGGFLVRKDNEGTTDRRWWPGDPKPGDLSWRYADYYWTFAAGGFNESAVIHGYDLLHEGEGARREVYEWEFIAPESFDLVGMATRERPPMNDWKSECDGPMPIPGDGDWSTCLRWDDMMPWCAIPSN